jgi:nitrogen regulatory protein PII-like uncharacterized protein
VKWYKIIVVNNKKIIELKATLKEKLQNKKFITIKVNKI